MAVRALAPHGRGLVLPLVLFSVALPPLLLVTWGLGRALSASEVSRVDVRLAAVVEEAAAAAERRTDAARARATALARSPAVQQGLRRRDLRELRRIVGAHPDTAIMLPDGGGRVGSLPGDASVVRRVEIASGATKLGTVAAAASLRRLAMTRDDALLVVARGGTILAGAHAGERVAEPRTSTDVALAGVRYRALAARLGPYAAVALIPRGPVDAAVRRTEARMVAAVLATLAAISLIAASLVRGRRRRASGEDRSVEGLALVEGAFSAVHNPDAMLSVVLETAVAVSGATGGHLVWRGESTSTGATAGREASLEFALRDAGGGRTGQLTLIAPARGFGRDVASAVSEVLERGVAALEGVRRHRTIQRLALTDELTELANRRGFREVLRAEVEHSKRSGAPLSLVLADLDGFKQVNDELGHQVGDQVLQAFARVVAERTRGADIAARLGGDEFAVLLPGTPLAGAIALAENLRAAVHEDMVRRRLRLVTASFGVGERLADEDGDDLLREADDALYNAKRSGRDGVATAQRQPG